MPLISSPSIHPFPLPCDPPSGATLHVRKLVQGERHRHAKTIDILPDDVLLEIFDFCVLHVSHWHIVRPVWKWHSLVLVCRRWRQIVFASPQRLNLQIFCKPGTPVRKILGIWPTFPIVMDYIPFFSHERLAPHDEDNVIAALEHRDRVRAVRLEVTEKIAAVIQVPFPVLTSLDIIFGNVPVLPAEFLGRSAPSLQKIRLYDIAYPALPTLLLSTSDLVQLQISGIPLAGYISPEAMVLSLAALPRLKTFQIEFSSATLRPDRTHPPPVTRTTLPALNQFIFEGASEYLEDFVAQIDSPQLKHTELKYLNPFRVDVQVSQLSKFIDRSGTHESTPFKQANVVFSCYYIDIGLTTWDAKSLGTDRHSAETMTMISWEADIRPVSYMAQVLNQFSALLSTIVHLALESIQYDDDRDDFEWLPHLLRQFPTVQTLYVPQEFAGHVALALEDITGKMVIGVLPSLELIYLVGQRASSVEKFVASRRLSGRPVTVVDTDTEFVSRLASYLS